MGESLFKVLTKQIRNEMELALNDMNHEFDVRLARLILAQVTLNGALARPYHLKEIETLFYEIRKCLIEVKNLSNASKAFLLMTIDLYYSDFSGMSNVLNKFYSQILDEYDNIENEKRKLKEPNESIDIDMTSTNSFNLRNLRKDIDNLSRGLEIMDGKDQNSGSNTKINEEYLNRPLKASDRLKYMQRNNQENEQKRPAFRKRRSEERLYRPPSRQSIDGNRRHSTHMNDDENKCTLKQNASCDLESSENEGSMSRSDCSKNSKMRSPLHAVSTNQTDDITNTSPESTSTEPIKFEQNFNWLEALENDDNDFNSMLNDNKLETMSVISCTSNPVSPRGEQSRNRSRRSSLNRFRSEYYKQSTEDVNNPDYDRQSNHSVGRRSRRNYNPNHPNNHPQNFHHENWRQMERKSPRNDNRNGFNKNSNQNQNQNQQNDFERGIRNDQSAFRRNISRGGSVDSNIKEMQHGRGGGNGGGGIGGGNMKNRHEFYNRRNQENDNYDHYHSYNRKTHNRNKDTFSNLPPRLQRIQQSEQQLKLAQMKQQQHQHHQQHQQNDCDNSNRFNNRNNQNKGKYVPKALLNATGGNGGSSVNNDEGNIIIRRSIED